LFRDIVRANGMSARRGHTLLANVVAAGEVPLALTVSATSRTNCNTPARVDPHPL